MAKQTKKQKHDKRRAQKRKHEHQTEQMQEETARKHRSHIEEWIAIIVLLTFVPLMVFGALYWPGSSTGLSNGTYNATYVSSRSETSSQSAMAVLDVDGETVTVYQDDLTGNAAHNSTAFFQGYKDEPIQITVKNGLITWWGSIAAPK